MKIMLKLKNSCPVDSQALNNGIIIHKNELTEVDKNSSIIQRALKENPNLEIVVDSKLEKVVKREAKKIAVDAVVETKKTVKKTKKKTKKKK